MTTNNQPICMMIGCGEECKWWECLWAQECAQRQKVKEIQISCRQKYVFFFKFNFIFFLCFACGRLCVVIAVINFAVCRAIFWGEFFSLRVLDDLCWGIVCVWFSFYLVSVQSTIPCVCVCVCKMIMWLHGTCTASMGWNDLRLWKSFKTWWMQHE